MVAVTVTLATEALFLPMGTYMDKAERGFSGICHERVTYPILVSHLALATVEHVRIIQFLARLTGQQLHWTYCDQQGEHLK